MIEIDRSEVGDPGYKEFASAREAAEVGRLDDSRADHYYLTHPDARIGKLHGNPVSDDAVEFVYEGHPRDAVPVGLTPDGL